MTAATALEALDWRYTRRFHLLAEHLNLAAATGSPDARLEDYQIEHWGTESLFAITNKARQVGWSWTIAAEAVAEGIIVPRSTFIFVSINLDEAKEKIRYSNHVIEALDREVRPRKVIDNQLEIELGNGSRLISHACRPVRGKGRATVYLDEFAHYPNAAEIYTSAVPVTTRGGRLRIGSSPMGAGGKFYEIFAETIDPYPGYHRQRVPWWTVREFVNDIDRAVVEAPNLQTEERVRRFGTARIIAIFENMPLVDFQQEYETEYVDESLAWIPWKIIKRNQVMAQNGELTYQKAEGVDEAFDAIDEIARRQSDRDDREIEPVMVGGMDIGRKRNLSEIIVLGESPLGDLPLRLMISLENTEFRDQEAVVEKLVEALTVRKFLIDQTGLGMQLAENMERRFRYKVEGVDFTNAKKALWATELKVQMEDGNVPIPIDRDLSYQIHSIKRKITGAKNVVFDTEKNLRHHADKFWALALAVWAAGGKDEKRTASARSY